MKISRGDILFYCCIIMLAALFFSRALLSVTMALFVAVSFIHSDIKKQLKAFTSTPLLWGMSLLFLLPLISGWWSSDIHYWQETMRIKLPLFFLPLAFAMPDNVKGNRLSEKQWLLVALAFIAVVFAGTIWSMFQYAGNAAAINKEYLKAKTLVTPLYNDHVRFSWLVAVAVLLCVWLYVKNRSSRLSWLLLVIAGWLIIFLHILAARTGLFSFYITVLITGLYLASRRLNRRLGILLLAGLLMVPVLAYYTVPSFQNRVRYMLYDFSYVQDSHYLPGGNDAMRAISVRAGWDIMKENLVTGTGFGDLSSATAAWYASHYPQMEKTDMILPSSEWMIYGAGCGVPGLLLFSVLMCIPFFTRAREKLPWIILQTIAAFSLVADIGLEVQAGVFVYAFIVLCGWKWFGIKQAVAVAGN